MNNSTSNWWSKMSDINCKLGHLSSTPNNNINNFLPASYIFLCENVSFQAKKTSFAGNFVLFLQCEEI